MKSGWFRRKKLPNSHEPLFAAISPCVEMRILNTLHQFAKMQTVDGHGNRNGELLRKVYQTVP